MRKINRKSILLIVLILSLSIILVSCAKKDTNDVTDKPETYAEEKVEKDDANKDDDKNDNDDDKNEANDDKDDDKNNDDDDEYSDVYKAMASDLGVSADDDKYEAMVLPLGVAYDNETLKDVLSKLYAWTQKYDHNDDDDLSKLFVLVKDKEANATYLMAQEFYLVVPKYEDAEVSLKELELVESGELAHVKNEFLDGKTVKGPVLIAQNISDIAPNGEITIKSVNREVSFSPFVSLKDGEIMLDDYVYNAIDSIDETKIDTNKYDEDLFKEIDQYIPKF